MSLIEKLRLNFAASRYAKRLGPQLRHDYGGGGKYTVAQIRAGVRKCHLPAHHIKLAYAAFMTEEAFRTAADQGDWSKYAALRALYFDHVPLHLFSKPDAPEDPYVGWGGRI